MVPIFLVMLLTGEMIVQKVIHNLKAVHGYFQEKDGVQVKDQVLENLNWVVNLILVHPIP